MGVLAAVHGRTAKGLPQVYQRIFRLEQLDMGVVLSIHTHYIMQMLNCQNRIMSFL